MATHWLLMARFRLDEAQLDAWLRADTGVGVTVAEGLEELRRTAGYFHLEMGARVTLRARTFALERHGATESVLGSALVDAAMRVGARGVASMLEMTENKKSRNPLDLLPILEGKCRAPNATDLGVYFFEKGAYVFDDNDSEDYEEKVFDTRRLASFAVVERHFRERLVLER